ncbi:MAG: CarD family transcriptional regulator [Myxococcaceae bacterium]|nr:CarD family transcriptional regulator [Myxococcaceae bacterium]
MPDVTPAPAAPLPVLNLSVGDRVVYPNQGLCNVTEIATDEIAGQKLVFVTLRFVETGGIVKVPKDKLAKNGVRRIATPDDVKKVFEFLRSDSERASLDWKKRARDNTERLSIGGLIGLAEVVKGLQVLSELRPLPPKEREQYNDARHLFVSELAAALNCTEADAEDALDVVLFPPGKERPKRSIEEFQGLMGDDLLGDDLLGLDGEAGAGEEEPEEKEKDEESSEEAGDDEDAPKKKPAKAAAEKPKKKLDLDAETTVAQGAALDAAAPKKRGRPPKPKPEPVAGAEPAAPKKRGRPPKPKPAEAEAPPAAPKKRGRPPKAK